MKRRSLFGYLAAALGALLAGCRGHDRQKSEDAKATGCPIACLTHNHNYCPVRAALFTCSMEFFVNLQAGNVAEVASSDIPAGAEVRGARIEWDCQRVTMLIEHPSLPEVAPGGWLPWLNGPTMTTHSPPHAELRALLAEARDLLTPIVPFKRKDSTLANFTQVHADDITGFVQRADSALGRTQT